MDRSSGIALPNRPAWDELRVGIDSRPGPHVTRVAAIIEVLWFNVLGLGKTESPALVNLDSFAGQIAKYIVLIFGTRRSEVHQEFCYRILSDSSHANGGPDAAAFNQGGYYATLEVGIEAIHADHFT